MGFAVNSWVRGSGQYVIPPRGIRYDADGLEIALFSRTVYLTVLARRSRHHAGARYLTRGANEHGHVANEVESEQM